jgi:DNA (cytosine-5)-methyltransferase 1
METGSKQSKSFDINEYAVVDLFCGIGGLSYGFIKKGFKVVAGIDIDSTCKYAYEKNIGAKFYKKDLDLVSSDFIKNLFPKNKKKILIGCAPCQAFSTYSQKYKDNDKWKLLYTFSRIIRDIMPDIISMENVPNLKNYKDGEVLADFINVLEKLKYKVEWKIVDASEYGVPQNRKRLILFASRKAIINIIKPTHKNKKITVKKAIGKLPPIKDGVPHPKDPLHRARKLSPLNKKRIIATPAGGSWSDWPKELLLECHKKDSGKSFGSVYGRIKWDAIAPTMTTQCTGLGNGRFGHPEQDRAISIREAAIFQSFPKNYALYDPNENIAYPTLEQHIGNAVPVRLGKVIATSISRYIKQI